MPDLLVVTARPVSVSRNGKVKARKRKKNDLGTLGTVTGFVYPGGNQKLVKDLTTDPYAKKKKKKAKAKKRKNPGDKNLVIGPAVGTLSRKTYKQAVSLARALSREHPRSFVKAVSPSGREKGFVDGKPAVLRSGMWEAKNSKPAKRKANCGPKAKNRKPKTNSKRKNAGSRKPYKVVKVQNRWQVREQFGPRDWKAYGWYLNKADAMAKAKSLNDARGSRR